MGAIFGGLGGEAADMRIDKCGISTSDNFSYIQWELESFANKGVRAPFACIEGAVKMMSTAVAATAAAYMLA